VLNLYIVRHGETEWNKEHRIQGRLDSQLTEKGKLYARALGEKLKDTEFDQVITSPSERTVETAEWICGNRNIPIIKDERIMEMHMGPWQGMTTEEIMNKYPFEYECFMHRPKEYRNEEAECFSDMVQRAESFIQDLKKRTGNLLIITHGLFIKTLYVIFKEMDLNDFWKEQTVEGTSLTIIKLESDKMEWVLQGDMSHITENISK
jgi:probable phosphoglycerate mutase